MTKIITDDEETFERFTKRIRRPKGRRSATQLVVSETIRANDDDAPLFADPGLQELHERGLVDELLMQLKSGKEATVHIGRGEQGLVAVKIYTDLRVRSFRNEAVYREGRFIGNARLEKAIDQRTEKGMSAQQFLWIAEEYRQLCALYAAGVPVPVPLGHSGRVVVMSLIGDEDGPAPRLSDIKLSPDEAEDAFEQSLANLIAIARSGRVHGDYSTYNILWWEAKAWVIDLPQVVEFEHNPMAFELLERDVESLCHSFDRLGLRKDPTALIPLVWERAGM